VHDTSRTRICERESANNYNTVSNTNYIDHGYSKSVTAPGRPGSSTTSLPYGRPVVDDSDYDQHWQDRQLPGNQEIYGRANEQVNRRHEEYLENSARLVAGRYASRGAPGPRIWRPPGRVTGPSPRYWNPEPTGTPDPEGARRLTVMGFNLLVERARILRLTQGPRRADPPPVTTAHWRSPTGR